MYESQVFAGEGVGGKHGPYWDAGRFFANGAQEPVRAPFLARIDFFVE